MRPSLLSFNVAELGFTLASSSPAVSDGGSEARELFLSYCEILSLFCLHLDSSRFGLLLVLNFQYVNVLLFSSPALAGGMTRWRITDSNR